MPKILRKGLPPAVLAHLAQRVKARQITEGDLRRLSEWLQSEPDAPEGLWFKDFGSFKLCGEGQYPKTFLERGQAAKGEKL